MGATHVTALIRNPAEPDRCWEGLFLVDTGATDSLVPKPHLEAIGLEPRGRRVYELADGSEIAMDITVGEIEFMGETVGGTILFGADDAEPLLGVTALESVGIDPLSQRLKRRPAVRLKAEIPAKVAALCERRVEIASLPRDQPPRRTFPASAWCRLSLDHPVSPEKLALAHSVTVPGQEVS